MTAIILIVVSGFLYGIDYFRFCEPYGLNDSNARLGTYILFIKWWNIEIDWYTYKNRWQVDIKLKFIVGLKPTRRKHIMIIFNDTGVKICVLDIN